MGPQSTSSFEVLLKRLLIKAFWLRNKPLYAQNYNDTKVPKEFEFYAKMDERINNGAQS